MANTFHVSLNVKSIPEAVARYRKIIAAEPAKVRTDYAKFELADPPLVLSLNLGGAPGTVGHLGIRYPESDAVTAELRRAETDSLVPLRQDGVTCCYAKADKFWVRDPDGVEWEVYHLNYDLEGDESIVAAQTDRLPLVKNACCAS